MKSNGNTLISVRCFGIGASRFGKGQILFFNGGRDLTIFKNEMSEHSEFLVYNDMIRKSNAKIRILWKKRSVIDSAITNGKSSSLHQGTSHFLITNVFIVISKFISVLV